MMLIHCVTAGGTCNCITGRASPDPITFLAATNEYFADDAFTTNHPSPPAADLFTFGGSGLLTIGTLGIAAVAVPTDADDDEYDVDVDAAESDTDDKADNVDEEDDADGAVTPTFTCPPPPPPAEAAVVVEKAITAVEAIAEKDDDTTTEDDLMVVSAELEKVLGGRNSGTAASDLVASARVSFAMGVDCPLQGFLFGSPVSDVESRLEQPRDSNGGGRRTSLGELFMRTRFAEEKVALVAVEEGEDGGDATAGGERGDEKSGKEGGGGHKTLKKRVKDGKVAGGEGAPASAAVTKSKFQKV